MPIYEESVKLPKHTSSLCPDCLKTIDATVYEKGKEIWMVKECSEHGTFDELYWSSAVMYHRAERYSYVGKGVYNPQLKLQKECPLECGLCDVHASSTCLANIDVTNRCNLRCEWCFANAHSKGYVYEPTIEQLRDMLATLRSERPTPTLAVQFSGGEPTLREDLADIISMAAEMGFKQTQIATNGIKLAKDQELAQKLRKAGLNTVYLQFNGISKETDRLIDVKKRAVDNCRRARQGVVLVPTIGKGLNDHEIGGIIQYAIQNCDIIRGINFQPMAFTGAANVMTQDERNSTRFTLPDLAFCIETQTNGQIKADDFYPVPCVVSISKIVEAYTKTDQIEFSAHPHCGIATYLFIEDGKMIPINRFVDVEKFFGLMEKLSEKIDKGGILSKPSALMRALLALNSMVDDEKQPKSFQFKKMIKQVLLKHDYTSLGAYHWESLFIGGMHFMDSYNYDIERVKRCVIHYAVPGGLIIPFCAYNSGPNYREIIEKQYSIPLDEWERKKGKVELYDIE